MDAALKQKLNNKYNMKKAEARKRFIPFTLSLDEYCLLDQYLQENYVCAYTGVTFTNRANNNHPHSPTLERVDPEQGYSLGNIIWVTYESNQVADRQYTKQALSESQQAIANRINNLTASGKIKQACAAVEDYIRARIYSGTPAPLDTIHDDILMASKYITFQSKNKEHRFNLSFSDFKRLLKKKSCFLSGYVFTEEDERFLWIVDKEDPIDYNNIKVVEESIHTDLMKIVQNKCLTEAQKRRTMTTFLKMKLK